MANWKPYHYPMQMVAFSEKLRNASANQSPVGRSGEIDLTPRGTLKWNRLSYVLCSMPLLGDNGLSGCMYIMYAVVLRTYN